MCANASRWNRVCTTSRRKFARPKSPMSGSTFLRNYRMTFWKNDRLVSSYRWMRVWRRRKCAAVFQISMFITVYLMDLEQHAYESYLSALGRAILRRRQAQSTIACFLMGIDVKVAGNFGPN